MKAIPDSLSRAKNGGARTLQRLIIEDNQEHRLLLTRHIPVIALTAHDTDGDQQRCLAAGCNAYFAKPIDFGQLLKTIAQLGPTS